MKYIFANPSLQSRHAIEPQIRRIRPVVPGSTPHSIEEFSNMKAIALQKVQFKGPPLVVYVAPKAYALAGRS
jgi:hypothetical protein